MTDEYFTVEEVAARLKVSRQAVYNWITEGRLRAVKAGRAVRISRAALDEFLQPAVPGDTGSEPRRGGV
jgi:excisionase family DNA binding protein